MKVLQVFRAYVFDGDDIMDYESFATEVQATEWARRAWPGRFFQVVPMRREVAA